MNDKISSAIRAHYRMSRLPTPEEVRAEVASLARKAAEGSLDDLSAHLWAAVQIRRA